jgi:hypothetical protein
MLHRVCYAEPQKQVVLPDSYRNSAVYQYRFGGNAFFIFCTFASSTINNSKQKTTTCHGFITAPLIFPV